MMINRNEARSLFVEKHEKGIKDLDEAIDIAIKDRYEPGVEVIVTMPVFPVAHVQHELTRIARDNGWDLNFRKSQDTNCEIVITALVSQ